jgi:hypothetical protein
VGEFLSFKGSRKEKFKVDFIAWDNEDGTKRIKAIEVNLRSMGMTHPWMTLQLLHIHGATNDVGDFLLPDGTRRCYWATDSFMHDSLKSLTPEDFMDMVNSVKVLQYDKATATGTIFHMIDSLSSFGKIGIMCIGILESEAERLFRTVKATLLAECESPDLSEVVKAA